MLVGVALGRARFHYVWSGARQIDDE
jgi:hypothetical protein